MTVSDGNSYRILGVSERNLERGRVIGNFVDCRVGEANCVEGEVACGVEDLNCSKGVVPCRVGDFNCSKGEVPCTLILQVSVDSLRV